MLVNASSFPGPALWQGLMLCALPVYVCGLLVRDGKYAKISMICYLGLGVILLPVIALL